MGQCYAVYIQAKSLNKPLLLELTNKYLKENNVEDNFTDWKEAMKEVIGNIKDKELPEITEEDDGSVTFDSCFGASYGYHEFMTDWFEAVASAFPVGTECWVYPDSGASRQVINQDYTVSREDLDNADLVDYNPTLKHIYNRIAEEVSGLDADQMNEIKNYLGEYGDEDCCVEEQLGEDSYAELTEEQCQQIIQIIKEVSKDESSS